MTKKKVQSDEKDNLGMWDIVRKTLDLKESQKDQYASYIKVANEAYKLGYIEAKNKYEPPKTNVAWKNDYNIYIEDCEKVYERLRLNSKWVEEQSRINPNINVLLSLERAYLNFWGTTAGWEYSKKKKRSKIDWELTFKNALSMPQNRVWNNSKSTLTRQPNYGYNKFNKPQ